MPSHDLSLTQARRLALAAQGFHRARPTRVDARHLRRTIRELKLLQIDYVNVLGPAQYLVPFSRLGPYDRSRLDELVYARREFTEQWAHEASILPVEHWPLLRHRRDAHRTRPHGFDKHMRRHEAYVESVLETVERDGPVAAHELPEPPAGLERGSHAWSRSVQRCVLEAFFGSGTLAVAERLPNFARTYDLAERIVPPAHHAREIDPADAQRELILLAAQAQGVATPADLADYYRMPMREVRPRIAELVEDGKLSEVTVEGWRETALLDPAARRPRRISATALLSPFDPLVWHRPRARRLFDFDYKLEIFIPERKRKWGYYVLPFLLGDRLVARVDLKAERGSGRLRVIAAYLEPGQNERAVANRLASELRELADWYGLDTVSIGRRGDFSRPLAAAARASR